MNFNHKMETIKKFNFMKNLYYFFPLKIPALIYFVLLTGFVAFAQPSRDGSINLANNESDRILLNQSGSGVTMGIEGGAFTVEAWVYMTSNTDNDFNFFRFISGNYKVDLAYRGDGSKGSDAAWYVETDGLPEKNGGSWNWYFGYKSGYTPPTFLNQWHHVAFVCNSSSTVAIFIDGEQATDYWHLTNNGGNIAHLFPNGGDGKCEIGGASVNKGTKGTHYVSEVRVWKTELSASTISKYYDEEVNKSHPDWNSLVRYYHGTKSNGTGTSRTFPDCSPINKYDATVDGLSTVAVSTDYNAPVKPAAFNNNTFSINFSAADCQTSSIGISWTNMRSSSFGYKDEDDIYYQILRDGDDKEIYTGNGTSTSDSDVGEGDKYRYKLRTFWQVNGVNYYSDDEKYSDYGTIKDQYSSPTNFTASTGNCDQSVDLSWDAADGTPPDWTIERSNNSSFTSGNTYVTTSLNGSNTSYTASDQTIETNLYYRVIASGTDANGCTVSGTWSESAQGFTSKVPNAPTDMSISQDLVNKTLNLSWTNPNGNNADSWIITRTKADGSDEITYTTALGTTSYTDSDLELCQTYSYTIGAVNECATDGNYATTSLTGNVSTDLSDAISSMEASKGYYSNSVQLEWTVNGSLSNIDRFRIYRSKADENNFSLLKILNNDLVYSDATAIGGTFYNYKVVGEAACDTATIYTNEGIDMGFVIPFGVANGHIEYDGGNAVENVTVDFERQAGNSGHSLLFDSLSYVETGQHVSDLARNAFTLEAWIKTSCTSCGIINKSNADNTWERGEQVMYLDDQGRLAFVGNACNYISGKDSVNDNEWHHVAIAWDYATKTRKAYIDGKSVSLWRANYTGNASDASFNLQIGRMNGPTNEASSNFSGNIDEIRVWNTLRSDDEIAENYNRVINGSETGLVAYWRCDEGIGTHIYDASQTDDVYNKHDGTFSGTGNLTFSSDIPDSDLLGIRGITNASGDYTVNYIPYKSGGEIFQVTPTLGQHAFEPATRTIFVGDGAQTQNGLDFTDISSFTVTGNVTYKNSQVPVEGVAVLLDGVAVLGTDNKQVRTDAQGNYQINVPIGKHYISAVKDGHVFSEGYFPPLDAYGEVALFEFTEDIIVNFTDSTKVKVAGRIVGGTREGDKEIGFGLSVNNIGVADLQFQLQKDGYDLDVTNDSIYNTISLTTDPTTGEYEVMMLPEKWVVNKAGNDNYFIDENDLSIVDLGPAVDTTYTVSDTSETAEVSYFSYNYRLDYIIREQPQVTVTNKDGSEFSGDSVVLFSNQETGNQDTLLLGSDSPFAYPVYQMGKGYGASIFVYEYYSNPDNPKGPVSDYVPVSGANITINDQLMANPVATTAQTGDDGTYAYSFQAGIPNVSQNGAESYTKTFEVDVTVDQTAISWRSADDPYRAYVLGSSPVAGSDFISEGPEVPEIILRDPPGSNSYAYIEEGSTYSETSGWSLSLNDNSAMDNTISNGALIASATGVILWSTETDDEEIGVRVVSDVNVSGNYQQNYTFTERIQTSSDPEDVGSDADLYIGKSYNVFFTKSENLKIMPRQYCIDNGLDYYSADTSSKYVLGIIDGFMMDAASAATYFIYSQKQIINDVIPNLMVQRNSLLQSSDYISHFPASSPYYGVSNNSPALSQFIKDTLASNPSADTTHLSYTFVNDSTAVDSVEFYNTQITQWLNAVALNEAEKASAETVTNLSIDGSSGAYTSEIDQTNVSSYNWNNSRQLGLTWNSALGVNVNGEGFLLKADWTVTMGTSSSTSTGNSQGIKFGYVIDERDEGDYYSIDVKKEKGVAVFSRDDFSFGDDKNQVITDLLIDAGISGGTTLLKEGTSTFLPKLIDKFTQKASTKINAVSASIGFSFEVAEQIYSMVDMTVNAVDEYGKIEDNSNYKISSFKISSPIFSVKGGRSKCPYEGEEVTSFYLVNGKPATLNTATLQREVPVIGVTPAIRNNVPESGSASFTLQLGNQSASGSGNWYEISIDESTNPNGAILLIDGLTAERQFYVDAYQTVDKVLTLSQSQTSVMNYDSIAVIFHSTCQYDPTSLQTPIADTVYISAHFLPSCSAIELTSMQDNWIINYADSNKAQITLSGYDLNLSTLERIDYEYKTLSGSPVTVKAWFTDTTSDAYHEYTGAKDILNTSSVSTFWDVSDLTDRSYELKARAVCTDGSSTETDYVTGVIDRVTPTVFGTPQPSDGILNPSDDISVRFNETIESGLVQDHNISVQAVLNGSDVSHATSAGFNGTNEYARIPSVSFYNKSVTIEYWLKRNAGTAGTVFSKGAGDDQLEIGFNADETIAIQVGQASYSVDPTSYYSSVYPVDGWHHWGLSYDQNAQELKFFMDSDLLLDQNSVHFNPANAEEADIARSIGGTNYLACQVHELRIWEKALTVSQSYANMNSTLSGQESGLYGYWPMDEGDGTLALDKSAGRDMTIKGTWELYPGSDAYQFNGTDQYLTLDGTNVVITDETNFTIEFWFNASTPGATQTLFSSGKGDLSDTLAANTEYALAINAMSDGSIVISSSGNNFIAVSQNFFDSEWHHFALVVDRKSTTRSYIDGSLQKSTSTAGIAGLAGSQFWMGARGFKQDPVDVTIDQYFAGSIDEFRIWNSARSAKYITNYMNVKLNGNEAGLLAYLPFEEYDEVQGTLIRNTTLNDDATPENVTQAKPAVATGSETFVSGASIRDVRPLQDIPFNFVVNDDEIVITPLIDAYKIENQTLEISVNDIFDLNGNKQLSTVSWTAYVQQNELVWQESEMNIKTTPGKTTTFQATIANLGGTAYDYSIENMPAWLTSDASSGTINPNSTKVITFSVSSGLNVGYYEQSLNLVTSLDFDEELRLNVAAYEPAPDWSVDSANFEYTMSLFGRLIIENVVSTDPQDLVAAFVGDEVRGVASVQYEAKVDAYMLYMTIYGNQVSGDTISFKVWDASAAQLHEDVTPILEFTPNAIVGTSLNPQDIVTGNSITETIALNTGWTWVSFNLETTRLATVDSIFTGVGSTGDIVKGQNAFDIYDNATGWYGNLTATAGGLKIEEMYKVHLTQGGTIKYSGVPVDPYSTPLTITKGWTYIGYTPASSMSVTQALAGINPASGDLVKDQNAFSMFDDGLGWVGSLKTMNPNAGYMYFSAKSASFTYPDNSDYSSARMVTMTTAVDLPSGWILNFNQYPDNMSVIAKLSDSRLQSSHETLVALIDNEVRGYAAPVAAGNGETLYFLTIHGNKSELLHFSLYNETTGQIINADNLLTFKSDVIVKSIGDPYLIEVEESAAPIPDFAVAPNPFSDRLTFQIACTEGSVEIYNALGMLVASRNFAGGNGSFTLENLSVSAGVYVVKVVTPCGTYSRKLIRY